MYSDISVYSFIIMALFFFLLFSVSYTVVHLSAVHAKHLSVANSIK